MFTGIAEEIGQIIAIRHGAASARLQIAAEKILDDLQIGDSVAVNGVCLTATEVKAGSFCADAMPETLRRTSLSTLKAGSRVNLERALQLNGRLGGHIVSGHIDGRATLCDRRQEDNALWLWLEADRRLLRYIIEKGSVALDGISLTVAAVRGGRFAVSLIPHSAGQTTLGERRVGDKVNLECDIIMKYIERLLQPENAHTEGVSAEFLRRCGFSL